MGSGKSTIGPLLANTLGYDFVDIDKAIEQKAQRPVVQIFYELGEQAFRTIEREAVEEMTRRTHCVISLGGGTIANEENFQLIRQSGIIVYLKLSQDEILRRVERKTDRPMLKNEQGMPLSKAELERRIDDLLRRRELFYARADIVISTDRKNVGKTVDEIVKELRRFPQLIR